MQFNARSDAILTFSNIILFFRLTASDRETLAARFIPGLDYNIVWWASIQQTYLFMLLFISLQKWILCKSTPD